MGSKRNIVLLVVFVLVVTAVGMTTAFGNDEITRTQEDIDSLNKKIKDIEQEADSKKKNQNKIVVQIKETEANIRNLEEDITTLTDEVAQTEQAVYTASVKLAEAEANIQEYTDLLGRRLRVMYKTGQVGYLEVLLGSKDFTDLMSRIDMLQKVYLHDTNLIEFMTDQRNQVAENKVALEDMKAKLETDLALLEQKKRDLDSEKATLEVRKGELAKDIKALESQEDALKEDADKLKDVLKNLQMKAKYVGGSMAWPAPGYYNITSPFGNRIHPIYKTLKLHTGIDIGVPRGKNITAAQSGTVIYSGWYGGYGKVVMIDHGGGIVTLYAHNTSLLVKVGEEVNIGDPISRCGSTGNSTGPHLHFEVRKDGQYVDPTEYVTAN